MTRVPNRAVRFLANVIWFSTLLAAGPVHGDTWLHTAPLPDSAVVGTGRQEASVRVLQRDDTGLQAVVRMPGIELAREQTTGGEFLSLICPGTDPERAEGNPVLPVVHRLFVVPRGATVEVSVQLRDEVEFDLGQLASGLKVIPAQPLTPLLPPEEQQIAGKAPSNGPGRQPSQSIFQMNSEIYARDGWLPAARATVNELGVIRGHRVFSLTARPVAYSPVQNLLSVATVMRVRIRFVGGEGSFTGLRPWEEAAKVLLNPQPGSVLESGPRTPPNYLIIPAPLFSGSAPLTQFVSAKQAQGYNVIVHSVATGTTRDEIKSYIQSLWATADAPDYLLLIGDALRQAPTASSYTIPQWVGGGAYTWGTDLPYACMDGTDDWYADIPFGRWPVRTTTELQSVVTKTLYVENGVYADPSYPSRAIFLAHPDVAALAAEVHDEIIQDYMIPSQMQSRKLYYDDGATEADVIDGFSDGCTLAVYIGHSTYDRWHAPLFTNTDIAGLTNTGMYPLVISFSCVVGEFWSDVFDPVMLEQFVRVPDKGAAACYGTAMGSLYGWTPWHDMYRCQMAALYGDKIRRIGPALNSAILKFVTQYGASAPVSRDFAEVWELLGDPSLSLPEPPQPNYLILTAAAYAGSVPLNDLIAAREARGFTVTTHVVASGTTNTALKTYVQGLWGTANAPDYILLVGDTDGTSATTACVPHFTGGGDKHAPTDWPYGCMGAGDDWYPEVPVGRFSVRTVASLQDVVNKTLYVEAGNYPDPEYITRGAFLANADTYGQAEPTHEWVMANCLEPAGCTGIPIYEAQGGDTADVAAALNDGCLYAVYMGHSSSSGWWGPSFGQSDINALTNEGLYGLVFGWSCNTSDFTQSECFGETWLRASEKGAAAYISASTYIYWGSVDAWLPSVYAEKAFFRAMFDDRIREVGPAWLAGLYTFLTEYGGWDGDPSHPPTQNAAVVRNFFEEFAILGDPALYLPLPRQFELTIDPASRDLCVPGDSTATYAVNVSRIGDFDEAVTLTVQGLPAGATASFSPNGQVPPFSSTLTVGNLASAPIGPYPLVITGTAASMQRTTAAGLQISSALPATPVLTSPASGVTGVARQPTLSWQASPQATTYGLQIATDAGFGNVVYAKTVTTTSHQVESELVADTQYFWRVMAGNGCGNTDYSAAFWFRTISQVNYFTEWFEGGGDAFDLDNNCLLLTPNGLGSYYSSCLEPITALPTDPSGGTTITSWSGTSDDGYALVNLSGGARVAIYGTTYASFYVGTNGFITFGLGDTTWTEELSSHFGRPRVSAVFDDLYPGAGGSISWKQLSDCVAVTWLGVPQYGVSDSNTFQIELFFDGRIQVSWLAVALSDAISGLSAGNGQPTDFVETNLSATLPCAPPAACCIGEACQVLTQAECAVAGGDFHSGIADCQPNPCVEYVSDCLLVTEIVSGAESGNCPRWIEITNSGTTDFAFLGGGLIVQSNFSQDVIVDVDLTGVVIPAGDSFVIVSNSGGTCTGAFDAVYLMAADLYTSTTFGLGNERFILTDTSDGSHLIDIYGVFGVNGTGQPWEFSLGYSHRLPSGGWNCEAGFAPEQWYLGGVGSLAGPDPTNLLRTLTTPGTHSSLGTCSAASAGDLNCDGVVNPSDIAPFAAALVDPQGYAAAYPGCHARGADLNADCRANGQDIALFVNLLLTGP